MHRTAHALFALTLALALPACSAAPDEDFIDLTKIRPNRRGIIGGTTDTGDPGVVMVLAHSTAGDGLCTGEVVSPHVVLTAAHCVDPTVVGQGNTFYVFLGWDVNDQAQTSDPTKLVAVKEVHWDTTFDVNNLTAGHDIGVVITKTALNIKPLPMNRKPLAQSDLGKTIRLVGYGLDDGADTSGTSAGVKRQVTSRLDQYDELLLFYGDATHNTCEGDSGGPALMNTGSGEVIIGVTSFGDQGCQQGGADTRVDVFAASFVDPYIAMFDGVIPGPDMSAPPDMGKGGDGGGITPGTVGAPCTDSAQCNSGTCQSPGPFGYCTAQCDPMAPSACINNTVCSGTVDGGGHVCVKRFSGGGGGCSVGGAVAASPLVILALAFVALALAARRRAVARVR